MKKSVIVIIIILVLAVLAGIIFFLKNKKSGGSAVPSMSSESNSSDKSGAKEGLFALLEKGTGAKCSVEDEQGKYTLIAKGEKARIDGMQLPDPKNPTSTQNSSIINDGEWAYVWSGKEGMKISTKIEAQNSASQVPTPEESKTDWKSWAQNMEKSGAKYDCSPTIATDSDFTPPNDVKFQSLDDLMRSYQQQMPGNPGVPLDSGQFQTP